MWSVINSKHFIDGGLESAKRATREAIVIEPDTAWLWGDYASFLLFTMGDPDSAIEKAEKAMSIMDYGNARFVLGSALYTKWAQARKQGQPPALALEYLNRAHSIYPHPRAVIQEARKHAATQVTAEMLSIWLNSRAET